MIDFVFRPSQQKQKAIVHVPKAEVSLSDELANAVRNARTGLRKVTPPEEKVTTSPTREVLPGSQKSPAFTTSCPDRA